MTVLLLLLHVIMQLTSMYLLVSVCVIVSVTIKRLLIVIVPLSVYASSTPQRTVIVAIVIIFLEISISLLTVRFIN